MVMALMQPFDRTNQRLDFYHTAVEIGGVTSKDLHITITLSNIEACIDEGDSFVVPFRTTSELDAEAFLEVIKACNRRGDKIKFRISQHGLDIDTYLRFYWRQTPVFVSGPSGNRIGTLAQSCSLILTLVTFLSVVLLAIMLYRPEALLPLIRLLEPAPAPRGSEL